jgi:hypothetical protein
LLVSDSSADLRIEYFDSHTNVYTLLVLPLALSIIYAVVSPWLGYVLKVVNGLPAHKRDIHTAEHEHKLVLEKAKYEKIRSQFLDDYQNELIANAKERADQIDQIQDQEIRDSLRQEVQESRAKYKTFLNTNQMDGTGRLNSTLPRSASWEQAMRIFANTVGGHAHHQYLSTTF